jgi:hypothetical protein
MKKAKQDRTPLKNRADQLEIVATCKGSSTLRIYNFNSRVAYSDRVTGVAATLQIQPLALIC